MKQWHRVLLHSHPTWSVRPISNNYIFFLTVSGQFPFCTHIGLCEKLCIIFMLIQLHTNICALKTLLQIFLTLSCLGQLTLCTTWPLQAISACPLDSRSLGGLSVFTIATVLQRFKAGSREPSRAAVDTMNWDVQAEKVNGFQPPAKGMVGTSRARPTMNSECQAGRQSVQVSVFGMTSDWTHNLAVSGWTLKWGIMALTQVVSYC